MDSRVWVNNGLMTFFFFVVGLEARREFDIGELRERRRVALPLAAGIGGMIVPVGSILAINAATRQRAAGAWRCRPTPRSRSGCWRSSARASPTGCARSCSPSSVVDDVVALIVIATVYAERRRAGPLLWRWVYRSC